MDDELVASGRYLRLETVGRRTGTAVGVVIGFVEHGDGSLVVAARTGSAWPGNLTAQPRCRVTVGERRFEAEATELSGADHAAAIRELILRYGTPAERLGSGPAFVLRPLGTDPSDASRRSR